MDYVYLHTAGYCELCYYSQTSLSHQFPKEDIGNLHDLEKFKHSILAQNSQRLTFLTFFILCSFFYEILNIMSYISQPTVYYPCFFLLELSECNLEFKDGVRNL